MRFLIDTNILIPLEPVSPAGVEPGTDNAADFVAQCNAGGFTVLHHPDSIHDIRRDRDEGRRQTRERLIQKYPRLTHPPALDANFTAIVGASDVGSNEWVDNRLLAAVHRDAVDYLVTEDGGIHRKAARLDLSDRVLTTVDAIALLASLTHRLPPSPPLVSFEPVHTIDAEDPILDSLRVDYAPDFDDWLARVKRQGRSAFTIRDSDGSCAAFCIVKPNDHEFELGAHPLKVSTFKVSDRHTGNRYGELLLKALFHYCAGNGFDAAWVTVFEKHENLISLLEQFGFVGTEHRSPLGELVLVKRFVPASNTERSLTALEHHVRFGPPALKAPDSPMAIIPIRPEFHRMLFPELETQQAIVGPGPFGNAIRKAYLSNGQIRSLRPGDVLLFYRSTDARAVTTVGIAERILVSDDPVEINRFVGGRTVYSADEVHALAQRDVVGILFRQDRSLEDPISIHELIDAGALRGAPQTISRTLPEAQEWLLARIGL